MANLKLNKTGLEFTRYWFLKNYRAFREHLYPQFFDKSTLYLELGVFEGMSMCWMLQRVLTHPDSRAVGIDPWLMTTKLDTSVMEDVMRRAYHNTNYTGGDRCRLYRANSAEILRKMVVKEGFAGITIGSVDLCFVDGNHNALAVLDDARLVFKLMKPGGWMLFDDVVNDYPKPDHVRKGLDMFLAEAKEKVSLVWKGLYCECFEAL